MAVSLLAHEVSDLCLGKPPLRTLSISATVGDALFALKRTEESCLSVWCCGEGGACSKSSLSGSAASCRCVGKVCMVDIICFLCREENLSSPFEALRKSVEVLLPKNVGELVRHIDPHSSVLEAIDLILDGAQNLVVPIRSYKKKPLQKSPFNATVHNGKQYCWLTQEDVIRFLLNSIGVFSPIHGCSIEGLDIISGEHVRAIHYEEPAKSALPYIAQSHVTQTSVAIVDENEKLIGEISPFTLACCDETVAAAIETLSAGDLMAYIDCGGPPEDLIKLVKAKLKEKELMSALELLEDDDTPSLLSFNSSSSFNSSCSSDEESGNGKNGRLGGYSARMVKRSEAIVCFPWSSLVAVMIQALAHRVSYVWVVEEDGSLIGVVNFAGILKVFRQHCKPQVSAKYSKEDNRTALDQPKVISVIDK
ncbi:unnamed protein product [Rhodiola kirilowii]